MISYLVPSLILHISIKDNRIASYEEGQEQVYTDNSFHEQKFYQFSMQNLEQHSESRIHNYEYPNAYYMQTDDIQISERIYRCQEGMEMNKSYNNLNGFGNQNAPNSMINQNSINPYHKDKNPITVPQFLPVNRQTYLSMTHEFSQMKRDEYFSNNMSYHNEYINNTNSYMKNIASDYNKQYHSCQEHPNKINVYDNSIHKVAKYFDIEVGPDEHQIKGWNITPTNILKINFQPSNSDVIAVSLRCDESMGLSDPDIFLGASSPKFNISPNNLLYLPFLKISKEMLQGPTKNFEFKLVYSLIVNGKVVHRMFSRPFKIFTNGTPNQILTLKNHNSFNFVLKYESTESKRKKRNTSRS